MSGLKPSAGTSAVTEVGITGRTLSDRVLGWVGGAMMAAALLLLVLGGGGDADPAVAPAPPALELIGPSDGATLENPFEVLFRTGAPIAPQPGGWGRDGYHLHAKLDGREVMPRRADIRRQADGAYVWTLGRVPPAEVTVRLFWSDADHRMVEGAGTETVTVRVE